MCLTKRNYFITFHHLAKLKCRMRRADAAQPSSSSQLSSRFCRFCPSGAHSMTDYTIIRSKLFLAGFVPYSKSSPNRGGL